MKSWSKITEEERKNISIDLDSIMVIEKEDWKKAKGVKYKKGETNSAFIERDYNISCEPDKIIAVVKGYYIRWCSIHHQPYHLCENYKKAEKLNLVEKFIKEFTCDGDNIK